MSGDDDLRERFSRMRQEEAERAPRFAEVRNRVAWSRARSRPLAVLLAAAAIVGVALLLRTQLAPGPTSPAPSSGLQLATSARFSSIEGSVQVKFAGTLQWVNADRSMAINRNDLIKTGPGSTAEIRTFEGSVFQLRPDGLFVMEETVEDPASKRRRVGAKIPAGEVNFTTVAGLRISTPTVETTTLGDAEGNIQVQESGQSGVRMFRGRGVAQTRTGQRIELDSNQGVIVDAAGRPGQKILLPGVPTLLAPPHESEVTYRDVAGTTTLLAWKAVTGAIAYHVMLDYSPTFARPVVDRKDWKGASFELPGLDVGTYYWKVAAVDKEGAEGAFSELSRFAVIKAPTGPPPPLFVETHEPRGNILQVKGRTEPGASLTVNGQRVDVQADGSFNEFITFEGGRHTVVIRATGVSGGVSEVRRSVVVSQGM